MRGLLVMATVVVAVTLLTACGSSRAQEQGALEPPTSEPTVQADSAEGLPDYAYRSAMALKGYQIAVAEKDLLARLPCYCGCGQDPQYKNLRDCFLDDKGEFRSHGANCEVCQEEARDAAAWKAQGLSVREIRQHIDKAYEGRGKPTDTPPVLD